MNEEQLRQSGYFTEPPECIEGCHDWEYGAWGVIIGVSRCKKCDTMSKMKDFPNHNTPGRAEGTGGGMTKVGPRAHCPRLHNLASGGRVNEMQKVQHGSYCQS